MNRESGNGHQKKTNVEDCLTLPRTALTNVKWSPRLPMHFPAEELAKLS